MKKRVPITVENKKTVERKNNFPAGLHAEAAFRNAQVTSGSPIKRT